MACVPHPHFRSYVMTELIMHIIRIAIGPISLGSRGSRGSDDLLCQLQVQISPSIITHEIGYEIH